MAQGLTTRIFQGRNSLVIRSRQLTLPSAVGLRLVVVSDLHARDDWMPRTNVATVVQAVNAVEGADAVLLLGDYVGDDVKAIDWAAVELAAIKAPVYAVLGNHDHWTDPERIARAFERVVGARMLTNASTELTSGLWLAGIDSCWDGRPDPERAFADVPDGVRTVVLGHEPFLATFHQRFLHLAGHTHQGQIRVPLVGDWVSQYTYPEYSQPYPKGLYTRGDDSFVYTTAGVGFSTIGCRINCPAEIVVIDL